MALLWKGLACIAACGVLTACAMGASPAPTASPTVDGTESRGPAGLPLVIAVREDDFLVRWEVDAGRVRSSQALTLEATLTYEGDADVVEAFAGFHLIEFYLAQIDGPLVMDPVIESIGICHDVRRGEPVVVPYAKSGGFAEPGDPNYPLMNDFLRDPDLHFPPGRWRITAVADFTLGCEQGRQRIHIEAPGELIVED